METRRIRWIKATKSRLKRSSMLNSLLLSSVPQLAILQMIRTYLFVYSVWKADYYCCFRCIWYCVKINIHFGDNIDHWNMYTDSPYLAHISSHSHRTRYVLLLSYEHKKLPTYTMNVGWWMKLLRSCTSNFIELFLLIPWFTAISQENRISQLASHS